MAETQLLQKPEDKAKKEDAAVLSGKSYGASQQSGIGLGAYWARRDAASRVSPEVTPESMKPLYMAQAQRAFLPQPPADAPVQRMEGESAVEAPARETENTPNQTGIPDGMKSRFEAMSGLSFDDVKIHYSSAKPAQLQALAYTQGNQVYVGPGQEKHLPHELGHVVQQKQGRVKPTAVMGKVEVNDDTGLEREASSLGEQAVHSVAFNSIGEVQQMESDETSTIQMVRETNHARFGKRIPVTATGTVVYEEVKSEKGEKEKGEKEKGESKKGESKQDEQEKIWKNLEVVGNIAEELRKAQSMIITPKKNQIYSELDGFAEKRYADRYPNGIQILTKAEQIKKESEKPPLKPLPATDKTGEVLSVEATVPAQQSLPATDKTGGVLSVGATVPPQPPLLVADKTGGVLSVGATVPPQPPLLVADKTGGVPSVETAVPPQQQSPPEPAKAPTIIIFEALMNELGFLAGEFNKISEVVKREINTEKMKRDEALREKKNQNTKIINEIQIRFGINSGDICKKLMAIIVEMKTTLKLAKAIIDPPKEVKNQIELFAKHIYNGSIYLANYAKNQAPENPKLQAQPPAVPTEREYPTMVFETFGNNVDQLINIYLQSLDYPGYTICVLGLNERLPFYEYEDISQKFRVADPRELFARLQQMLVPNHDAYIVPFAWKAIGGQASKDEEGLIIDKFLEGKVPKSSKLGDYKKSAAYAKKDISRELIELNKIIAKSVGAKADGGYDLPYFEVREHIMRQAKKIFTKNEIPQAGALFRWIDRDAEQDTSSELDPDLLAQVSKLPKAAFVSGVYNWRKGGPEEKDEWSNMYTIINKYETDLRRFIHIKMKEYIASFEKKISPPDYGALSYYLPEPVLIMNSKAHDEAIARLSEQETWRGKSQANESKVAYGDISDSQMIFRSGLSVSKPNKNLPVLADGALTEKSYLGDLQNFISKQKKIKHGQMDQVFGAFCGVLKKARQSAFNNSHWGVQKTTYPEWDEMAIDTPETGEPLSVMQIQINKKKLEFAHEMFEMLFEKLIPKSTK